MFNFQITELLVTENKIEINDLENLNDSLVIRFLNHYEQRIYHHLKENKLIFKYIQSTLKSNFFQLSLEKFSGDFQRDYNIYNLTQHPNYVGNIVINNLINFNNLTQNYVITYENPIAKNWLNSKISYMDVINFFNKLIKHTTIKKNVKITFIRINNSDLIKFKQTNLGSSQPKYKLLENES